MSALGGGFNRSTQHSISFFLLGFESQGLAHTASDPKVPGFSAAVKRRKNSRCFIIHPVLPLQDRECCVDRLNRQSKADIEVFLLNDLVRLRGQIRWHLDAKRFGGLE